MNHHFPWTNDHKLEVSPHFHTNPNGILRGFSAPRQSWAVHGTPSHFAIFFVPAASRDVSFVASVIRLLVVPTLTVILKFGIDFIPNFVSSIHNFPRMSRGCYLPCFFQRFQMPTNFHKRYPSHPPGPSSAPSSSGPKFHRRTLPGAHAPALLWFEAPGEKRVPCPTVFPGNLPTETEKWTSFGVPL